MPCRTHALVNKKNSEQNCFFTLSGLDLMSFNSDQTWQNQIYSLFVHAKIPTFYIKHIYTPEYFINHPNTVFIFVINKWAKKHIMPRLRKFVYKKYTKHIKIF